MTLSPLPPLAARRLELRRALDLLREARWLTRRSLLACGFCLALISVSLLVNYFAFDTGKDFASDFTTFFSGAKAAAAGLASRVYDPRWFNVFVTTLTGDTTYRTYDYPPLALLLLLPFALVAFVPALIAWLALGAAACVALLRRLVGWPAAALALIAAPASGLNVFFGQNGYLTAALFAAGLMLLENRPVLAGIAFACLAYKPQMALMVPVALLAGRQWRAFLAAAIAFAALGLLTAGLFGPAAWIGFFSRLAHFGTIRGPGAVPTVLAAARSLGARGGLAYLAQAASAALALAATALLWRRPAPAEVKYAALPVATFLATPYALPYDQVVLIFAAAWLGREGLRTGFLAWERLAVAALLILPLPIVAVGRTTGLQLAPMVLWPIFGLLLRRGLTNPPPALAARAAFG